MHSVYSNHEILITKPSIRIRTAEVKDSEIIARLVGELGYPAEPREITPRLEALARSDTGIAFVAEIDSRVVGLATGHVFSAIHSTHPVGWLSSLVVSSDAYRQGVGRALVDAAESWVRSRGAVRINLTSALRRTDAHEFYEHLGYLHTGVRLTKELSG